jgi:transcriptional regulator with XRE-family HTH domain
MFRMLDMQTFGAEVRRIREEKGFTRKTVEELTGITKETLRKLEKGDVVPQLSTLQLLSVEYKIDLIVIFNRYKQDNLIFNTHDHIDKILLKHVGTTDSLEEYLITPENTVDCNLIDPIEIQQFNSVLYYIPIGNDDNPLNRLKAIDGLTASLSLHHQSYCLEDLEMYSYSYIEQRILLLIGVYYAELNELDKSNQIFEFLYKTITIDKYATSPAKQLYIKLICNIAYNHHSLDHHQAVLMTVNEGIAICNNYNSSYLIEVLLYRKAVAQYFLHDSDMIKTFRQVRSILEIKNYDDQIELYKNITKAKYDIEF